MKRTVLFALMIMLPLLCSCDSGGGEEDFTSLREAIISASALELVAEVTAQNGRDAASYTLIYSERDGAGTITVIKPDILSGVTAHTVSDSWNLEFDGLILELDILTGDGLTPLTALPALVSALRTAHVNYVWTEAGGESELLAVELMVSDETTGVIRLDAETKSLVDAEIRTGEKVVITCVFDMEQTKIT